MKSKTRKAKFVSAGSRPNSDINVTPLVDVVLVLLIIFMVVTPLLDKEITVAVPKMEEVDSQDEVPAEQLLVKVDKQNALTINGKPIALTDFQGVMRKHMDVRMDAYKVIFLMTDDEANYGFVVQVVDRAVAAGVKTVATATTPPDAPPPPAPPAPPGVPTPGEPPPGVPTPGEPPPGVPTPGEPPPGVPTPGEPPPGVPTPGEPPPGVPTPGEPPPGVP